MNQAKGNFAVLNLKSDFDGVKFSDMDKIYYRRMHQVRGSNPCVGTIFF